MIKLILILSACVFVTQSVDVIFDEGEKIVIDNDAGTDDALGIFIALLYEKFFGGPELVALTTCNGNTIEENVCYNNQRILKDAKRQDVPIYRGSKSPLLPSAPNLKNYHGVDGLGDVNETVTYLKPPKEELAAVKLIELSKKYKGNISVIALGPVTNIAMAIRLDPRFLGRLKQLYIGGGHIHGEDYPKSEFNVRTDVEAYHIVVRSATPDKVTVVPFSQIKKSLNFTNDWRQNVLGGINSTIMQAQNKYEKLVWNRSDFWSTLDPATVAVAIKPDLVEEYKYSKNDIILCGDERAITTNEFVDKAAANVRLVYSVKNEEYKQFLIDVFEEAKNGLD